MPFLPTDKWKLDWYVIQRSQKTRPSWNLRVRCLNYRCFQAGYIEWICCLYREYESNFRSLCASLHTFAAHQNGALATVATCRWHKMTLMKTLYSHISDHIALPMRSCISILHPIEQSLSSTSCHIIYCTFCAWIHSNIILHQYECPISILDCLQVFRLGGGGKRPPRSDPIANHTWCHLAHVTLYTVYFFNFLHYRGRYMHPELYI